MPELTEGQMAEADAQYEKNKPDALLAGRNYMLARTPPEYQEYISAKIDADFAPPPEEIPEVEVAPQDPAPAPQPAP